MMLLLLASLGFAGDADAGRLLYEANCTACHGTKGDGKGPAAIALKPRPNDFTSATWWKSAPTDEAMAAVIRGGKVGTGMTGFTQFSPPDIENLLAYVRTFAPSTPAP